MANTIEKHNFSPKVSIVIPVYNGAEYMREAIDSALAQTYENIEVLVINDGSCDDGATEQIALSYGDKIRYFSKENGGVSTALNLGIAQMTGEYFSWLSHDDKYEPEKVEDEVRLLEKFTDRDTLIAYTGHQFIDAQSKVFKDVPMYFNAGKVYTDTEVIRFLLTKRTMDGCCMLIPKSAFETCGGFHEDLRYNQDALMWYKFFTSGYQIVSDGKKNVMYRIHKKQTSQTKRELLQHDTLVVSKEMIPVFIARSTPEDNLLYYFALRNAKYACRAAVHACLEAGKIQHALSCAQRFSVRVYMLYGKLREMLKRIYTKLRFKG
ncbi:MAG: glycosyltransferase family 2 protein [Candidatus Fimenecus sp.]